MGKPYLSEKDAQELVTYAIDSKQWLESGLSTPRETWFQNWRRYNTERDDPRDLTREKWRAHIVVPQAFYNVEALAAQDTSLIMDPDPPFQVRPTSELSEDSARAVEKLIRHTLYINSARQNISESRRAVRVQGIDFFKTTWRKRAVLVPTRVTAEELHNLSVQLKAANDFGFGTAPDWITDPEGFEEWRMLANKANANIEIPPAPQEGIQERVMYWGPEWRRIAAQQMFFDPLVSHWDDQPVVIHQMIKTAAWLKANTGDGPQPFDPIAVDKAMSSYDAEDMTRTLQSELLKAGTDLASSPHYYQPIKLWEVYRPGSEFPYTVVLNEQVVINKNCHTMPFEHGMVPIQPIRNIKVPGATLGMSDITPNRTLFEEVDKLRSLRMDAVTLHTIPVYRVSSVGSGGITDIQKQFIPGGIVQAREELKPILGGTVNPAAYQEIPSIQNEIDRSMNAGDQLRGATASVGRIPASTEQARFTQVLVREKASIGQFEDDMRPMLKQFLGLWLQFGFNGTTPEGLTSNPLQSLDQNKLQVALDSTFELVGSTEVENRPLQAQQLMAFADKFGLMMMASEKRALMKQVAEALDLRNVASIVSPEGDKMMENMEMAMKQQQAAGAPPGPAGGPGPSAPPGGGGGQ